MAPVAAPPVAPAAPAVSAPATPPVAPTPGGKRPIWPLIVAGGGGATLVVGLLVYAGGAKDVKDFEKKCPNRLCPERTASSPPGTPTQAQLIEQGNAARRKQTTGGAIAGVGAVALAGGLIWYFVEPRSAETTGSLRKPRMSADVTPGFAGLSLSGAF